MSRRSIRYFIIYLLLYLFAFINYRKSKRLRIGFTYLQRIDDYMDRDLITTEEPMAVLKSHLDTKSKSLDPVLDSLYTHFIELKFSIEEIKRIEVAFSSLIQTMSDDYSRREYRVVNNRLELYKHMHKTFYFSVDLMIMVILPNEKTEEYRDLIDLLIWCSIVRDLEVDFSSGLYNIPSEFLQKTDSLRTLSFNEFETSPFFRKWLTEITEEFFDNFRIMEARVCALGFGHKKLIYTIFLSSARKYLRVMSTKYNLTGISV